MDLTAAGVPDLPNVSLVNPIDWVIHASIVAIRLSGKRRVILALVSSFDVLATFVPVSHLP